MTKFAYSIGKNRYDAHPRQLEAASLREFAADVLAHRAKDKSTAGYVCAPFGGDGRRSAANVIPRPWIAADVDYVDPDVLIDWRLFASRWRGFGWPTASSTPEAPRERIIIELSEPVDRHQGIAIGTLLARDVGDEFGVDVRIDVCTFRGEQPCFLAVQGVRPFYLMGDALDVPVWLEQAPPAPPPPPPLTEIAAAMADARVRAIVEQLGDAGLLRAQLPNERGYSMFCPWQSQHTSGDGAPSTTALLFPAEANGWRGGFSCFHTHCKGRSLRNIEALLLAASEAAV